MKCPKIGIAFLALRSVVRNANMAYHHAPCKQTSRFACYFVLHYVNVKHKILVITFFRVYFKCRVVVYTVLILS